MQGCLDLVLVLEKKYGKWQHGPLAGPGPPAPRSGLPSGVFNFDIGARSCCHCNIINENTQTHTHYSNIHGTLQLTRYFPY